MLFSGILETTTTTGTGDITVSAVTGRPRFSDVYTANATEAQADPIAYSILTQDNPPQLLEWGIGYLSAAGTFKRSLIIGSYASGVLTHFGSAVSLPAGTKNVVCSPDPGMLDIGIHDVLTKTSGGPIKAIGPSHVGANSGSSTITKDRLYYCPITLESPRRIVGVSVNCGSTALVAGGSRLSRAGIYSCQRNGLPGRKIVESGDTALNASFASVTLSFSAIRLPAGSYWLAFAADYTAASVYMNGTTVSGNSVAGWLPGSGAKSAFGVYESLTAGWASLPSQAAGEASLTLPITANSIPVLLAVLE